MNEFVAYGMCNPLFDLQSEVSDETLTALGYQKGSMSLISSDEQKAVISQVYSSIVNAESGGSGANSMMMIALLGGRACYTGCVGDDEHAGLYRKGLEDWGVKSNLGEVSGDTGVSAVLITPDAERTMLTCLGSSVQLDPDHVNWDDLRKSRYLYVTGYLWDTDTQKKTVLAAVHEAKKAGVKVAFSLSDGFCVTRHKDEFLTIVGEHVDVLFANLAEATTLTGIEDPHAAATRLGEWVEIAAVTMGSEGSVVTSGANRVEIEPYQVKPVDVTGAGDSYAGAFLYGLAQEWSLAKCGRLASFVGSQVVSHLGARIKTLNLRDIALD
jgi:sugar/nucleoside kinase (ribokinase family)